MPENEINTESLRSEKPGLLCIDDEIHNLRAFKAAFRREYDVYTALSAADAEQYLEGHDVRVIISDQRMPKMTGVAFFSKIKETHPEAIRILLTGYSDMEAVIDAINKGEVYRYLTKPWDADFMRSVVEQALELFNLRRQNELLVKELTRVNEQLEFYLRQKLLS